MKTPIYFNFKIVFFRYVSIQSSSSQGDQNNLVNGHGNLASLTLKQILHDITNMAKLYYTRTSAAEVMTFTICFRTFLAFYHYVLTLCARFSGVEKKIFHERH